MKKSLVFGLAALTVAAGVGFGGFSAYKANAQENIKGNTSSEQSAEINDVEVQLNDEQYAKVKNGEEITLNGMTITGLSKDAANFADEDVLLGDMDSILK